AGPPEPSDGGTEPAADEPSIGTIERARAGTRQPSSPSPLPLPSPWPRPSPLSPWCSFGFLGFFGGGPAGRITSTVCVGAVATGCDAVAGVRVDGSDGCATSATPAAVPSPAAAAIADASMRIRRCYPILAA